MRATTAQRPQRHRCTSSLARNLRQPPDLPDVVIAWRGRGSTNRVLGEREQRTCENCTGQTTPGVGLTPVIRKVQTKLQVLQERW